MKDILQRLGWNFSERSNSFYGCCPLHGGDNPMALSILKESGVWQCFTQQCHKKYGATLPNFLSAYIEKFSDTIVEPEFVEKWIKENAENFNYRPEISSLKSPKIICSREHVISQLDIPSVYYLNRGFSESVLVRHDVGLCKSSGMMYNRNVIPIYNHAFTGMIGCSGRLDTNDKNKRWMHSKGFPKDLSLYNSWFAESYVRSSEEIFIVEGPAKVWKMEEAGFFNVVATLGTSFTLNQKKVLSRIGPRKINLVMDNDDAGNIAASTAFEELKNLYQVKIIKTPFTDLDEERPEIIKEFLSGS